MIQEQKVLNRWNKYGAGVAEPVENHLIAVLIDNQYFIEIRDYYPDRDEYGSGHLIAQAGRINPAEEVEELSSLIRCLMELER